MNHSSHQLAVHATGVRKAYSPAADAAAVEVLRGVDLELREGEFVCLMGSSGSGKTTFLNLVGGLDAPDAGSLRVHGTDLGPLGDAERSAFRLKNIGFVFQFFNLLPNLSVRENIALPLLFLGASEREAASRAGEAAAEVGLDEKLDRQAHQLSGGEMQRVALARALVHRPALLLADEPTGNLDSATGVLILDMIRATAQRHRLTVLMATHDAKASEYADRTIRMRDGMVI